VNLLFQLSGIDEILILIKKYGFDSNHITPDKYYDTLNN